jgi:DNA polymerase III sliding clamp (beta) subunit (PCNA family)
MERASTAQFGKAVNALKAIACSDPLRRNLHGICFEKGRAIATDGHRACILTAETEGDFPGQVLIPREDIPVIKTKHSLHIVPPCDPAKVTLHVLNCNPDNYMSLNVPRSDADYPDVDRVKPTCDPKFQVRLDAKYVQELLEVHRQSGAKYVNFSFYGESWEQVPCRIESPGVESILMPVRP